MSLSAIRKSESPPKHLVAIHCTIAQKCGCDLQCLPRLIKKILATIYEPCMLRKHCVMWISEPLSFILLHLPQSTRAQSGVYFPSKPGQLVFHWLVSIMTTSLSSKALRCVLCSLPRSVQLHRIQSRFHASNCSQRNSMPLHHASLSKYHPLDLQAHLKAATLSGNTSHGGNGIPLELWLEVSIKFWLSSQYASPHSF